MRHDRRLEELWSSAAPSVHVFDPNSVSSLPPVAQRYLRHALALGAKCSTCARLSMTGTIKLQPSWCKFEFDRLVDGVGAMRWKLLGLFPVMKADGAEIARAIGLRPPPCGGHLASAALLETEVS